VSANSKEAEDFDLTPLKDRMRAFQETRQDEEDYRSVILVVILISAVVL